MSDIKIGDRVKVGFRVGEVVRIRAGRGGDVAVVWCRGSAPYDVLVRQCKRVEVDS